MKKTKAKRRPTKKAPFWGKEKEIYNPEVAKETAQENTTMWDHRVMRPGLHVRKSPDHEGNPQYEVVRAVSIDEGRGPCIKVYFQHGSEEFPAYQIAQSQFQRIEE
jgi:hypothetical protein